MAFSRDGLILASGNEEGLVILWDLKLYQHIRESLSIGRDQVLEFAFTHDGKILASGGFNGQLTLWETSSLRPMGLPFDLGWGSVSDIAFSSNGETLASAAGYPVLINTSPDFWTSPACLRAGRNFTEAEWKQYLPNQEYRKTCEQWPLEPETAVR